MTQRSLTEALGGFGKLWESLSERLWEALASFGRLWYASEGFGRVWKALGGFGKALGGSEIF